MRCRHTTAWLERGKEDRKHPQLVGYPQSLPEQGYWHCSMGNPGAVRTASMLCICMEAPAARFPASGYAAESDAQGCLNREVGTTHWLVYPRNKRKERASCGLQPRFCRNMSGIEWVKSMIFYCVWFEQKSV